MLQILQLHNRKHSVDYYTAKEYIWQTMDCCRGMPLAVALIAAQKLDTKHEWQNIISKMQRKHSGNLF